MKCSICNNDFEGFGNNPYPVRTDEESKCCDKCNEKYVLYFRIGLLGMGKELSDTCAKTLNTFSVTDLDHMINICESI